MPLRLSEGQSWVHVFREDTFGGRLRSLGPGERATIESINSIIVGPTASVHILDRRGDILLALPPRKVVPDLSELHLVKSASHLVVLESMNGHSNGNSLH